MLAAGALLAQEPLSMLSGLLTQQEELRYVSQAFFHAIYFFFSFEIVLGSQAGLKLTVHSQAGLELISLALLPV